MLLLVCLVSLCTRCGMRYNLMFWFYFACTFACGWSTLRFDSLSVCVGGVYVS